MWTRVIVLLLAIGLTGCDGSRGALAPSAPSPVPAAGPQPTPPAGVTSVRGVVLDSAFRTLVGASVEVADGPLAGMSATSDGTGWYTLTGAFAYGTRFRAAKTDHLSATSELAPRCATCGPTGYVYFYLTPATPPVSIAGDYTITFTAAASCDLPAEVRARSYLAAIRPDADPRHPAGTRFQLTITGASFLGHYRSGYIGVAGDYVSVGLGGEGPSLVEQWGSFSYLAFEGWARASVGPSPVSAMAASFDGAIEYCELRAEMGPFYSCDPQTSAARARCEAADHRVVLTRR